MWSQRLVVPATTEDGTGGYTHYTFNIGNYVYGKFTIMARSYKRSTKLCIRRIYRK